MLRRVDSSTSRSVTAPTGQTASDAGQLRGKLRVGEILPAQVVRSVGPGRYLVNLPGGTFHAESRLDLTRDKVHVQVATLWPRIHLRLLTTSEAAPEWLAAASEQGVALTPFAQFVLARMKSNHRKRPLSELLDKLRRIADRRTDRDPLSLDMIVDLLDAHPELPDLLLAFMSLFDAETDTGEDLPELLQRFIEHPDLDLVPAERFPPQLTALNRALTDSTVTMGLVRWRDRVLPVETEQRGDLGERYRTLLNSPLYGTVGVETRPAPEGVAIHMDFEHAAARACFIPHAQALRTALNRSGSKIGVMDWTVRSLPTYLVPEDLVNLSV
jgi:hypothetical protein